MEMETWTCGKRQIDIDKVKMEFISSVPWRHSEIDAIFATQLVRSVGRIDDRCIRVHPSKVGIKDRVISAVKAVVMIHV